MTDEELVAEMLAAIGGDNRPRKDLALAKAADAIERLTRERDNWKRIAEERGGILLEREADIERLTEKLESTRAQLTLAKRSNGFENYLAKAEIDRLTEEVNLWREGFKVHPGDTADD